MLRPYSLRRNLVTWNMIHNAYEIWLYSLAIGHYMIRHKTSDDKIGLPEHGSLIGIEKFTSLHEIKNWWVNNRVGVFLSIDAPITQIWDSTMSKTGQRKHATTTPPFRRICSITQIEWKLFRCWICLANDVVGQNYWLRY